MGLIHTAAILSQGTEKALFYHPPPRSEKLGSEARQVKQSYFSLSGENGRRVTKARPFPFLLRMEKSKVELVRKEEKD